MKRSPKLIEQQALDSLYLVVIQDAPIWRNLDNSGWYYNEYWNDTKIISIVTGIPKCFEGYPVIYGDIALNDKENTAVAYTETVRTTKYDLQ